MIKFKKLFICILASILLVSGYVFANNETQDAVFLSDNVETQEVSDTPDQIEPLNQDVFVYGQEHCSIKTTINGNLFSSALQLVLSPDGGNISGDIFAISSELLLGSDVTYSDTKDKNGNYIVDTIKSNSVVDGNVYALADSFTIEAGSKINGNLYLVAGVVNIQQDAVIDGNVFIVADSINLNGKITGSAYLSAAKFTMNYYTYISRAPSKAANHPEKPEFRPASSVQNLLHQNPNQSDVAVPAMLKTGVLYVRSLHGKDAVHSNQQKGKPAFQ